MITEAILTTTSNAELVSAMSSNLYTLFRAMARYLPDDELEEGNRFSRHLTFPTNPMFKGVWATRLGPDEVDEVIDETIARFQARSAPSFFWWTEPDAKPDDLGVRLEARGLLSMEQMTESLAHGMGQTAAGAPIMAADLGQIDARATGYGYATLWSTEEGASAYRRIGFYDTGARLNRYLWRDNS